jgi:hypothetical protein
MTGIITLDRISVQDGTARLRPPPAAVIAAAVVPPRPRALLAV